MALSKKEIAANIKKFQQRQIEHVAKHGRTTVGVFAVAGTKDALNSTFVYTIGNALKRLPELFIVGMHDDGGVLNALSEKMIELGRAFEDREVVDIGAKFSCCVVEALDDVKDRYTCQASAWFGRDGYRVMQVVAPDPSGLFPWQSGCASPYSKVTVHRKNPVN